MCEAERWLSGDEMVAVATAIYNSNFKGQKVCEREDLIAEGVCGLIYAGEKYDENKGKFLTYAWNCACKSMLSFFNRERKHIGVPIDEIIGCGMEELLINESDDILKELDSKILVEQLKEIATNINKKKCLIINMIVDGRNSRDIAEEFGVSRQRISKIFNDFKSDINKRYEFRNGEIVKKDLTM